MVWIYQRGAEVTRLETKFDNHSSQFELTWHRPDGTKQVERFVAETEFRTRLVSVEKALEAERWSRSGAPQIQRDGWKV